MPGQRKPTSRESPKPRTNALASWLGASIAPQKTMQSSKNLYLNTAFGRILADVKQTVVLGAANPVPSEAAP
jgi:hypothetical protein